MNGYFQNPYIQHLNACLHWQSCKMAELEQKLNKLQNDFDQLSKQRTMNIDKIEYKFDQLKIEKLEGTLHIGVSPNVEKSIEDFTVNGEEVGPTSYRTESFTRIHDKVSEYLTADCPSYIRGVEEKYRMILGHDYRNVIIQDVRGQVDKRIDNYLKSMPKDGTSEQIGHFEQQAFEQIKTDIQTAIERHIQKHKESRADQP
ncbi:spore germination protein GerPC [Paenibacillus contaminans]|uniref:Uncharacterized protein n=1 Tax=Paenibacillus contaminans TaxID=450362 RepID=A0A329MRD8_9BACL|nr:spore germination protein GerPC [Paenibacillus contaminans]RAV22505.1 hypothetical protein DQG23_06100 [Paenibacillus contaminans]